MLKKILKSITLLCILFGFSFGIVELYDYIDTRPIQLNENQLQYEFINDNKEIRIKDYDCDFLKTYNITIPSFILDKPVTSINLERLPFHVNILEIPSTIKEIYGNNNINEFRVDLNNKVYDSRDNCKSLIETKNNKLLNIGNNGFIPEGVTSIDKESFFSADIKKLHIPASVVDIPNDFSFFGCYNLKMVTVDADNQVYDSRDNCNGIIKKDGNILIASCNNGFIPDSVTTIEERAYNLSNIKEIYIPASVKKIKPGAFAFCHDIKKVTVDSNNKYYNSRNNCNGIIETSTNNLIIGFNCTKIPENINEISSRAFYGCDIDFIDFSKNKYHYCPEAFCIVTFTNGVVLPNVTEENNIEYYSKIIDSCYIKRLYLQSGIVNNSIVDILENSYVDSIFSHNEWEYKNEIPQVK